MFEIDSLFRLGKFSCLDEMNTRWHVMSNPLRDLDFGAVAEEPWKFFESLQQSRPNSSVDNYYNVKMIQTRIVPQKGIVLVF